MMGKSLFIVVDGIDGSGKSGIVKMLHNYLFSRKKYRILTTREPTNGVYGRKIREMLRDEKDPDSNKEKILDLFIKDRESHLKDTILPFLDSSNDEMHIVLCDRYYYSTIAFQHAQGFDIKMLVEKNKKFRKPDIAFILDLEPKTALIRINKDNREFEKFEKAEFMGKVRDNFLKLRDYLEDNIRIIDANREIDEVFDDIKKEIDRLIS